MRDPRRHLSPQMIPPLQEWSPDDPVVCHRCGQTLRAGDTIMTNSSRCLAKTPRPRCPGYRAPRCSRTFMDLLPLKGKTRHG